MTQPIFCSSPALCARIVYARPPETDTPITVFWSNSRMRAFVRNAASVKLGS